RQWPHIRVLVLTGQTEDAYIMRALRAGANGYILKTTEEHALLQAVREVNKGHLVLGHGVAERVAQGFVTQESDSTEQFGELERLILIGIAAGLTNDQIAERARIDAQLVDAQLSQLIGQLGAQTRTETSLIALRRGMIKLDDVHNF
ncbi:MAG: response regulator transcription factor, partial [Anaerolineae bacterium]|nr:response regulator transcription factor [Anaerolineae bacterium]